MGQARKSLWIETTDINRLYKVFVGQARKSLWIETCHTGMQRNKLPGQARKSLWIETFLERVYTRRSDRSGS